MEGYVAPRSAFWANRTPFGLPLQPPDPPALRAMAVWHPWEPCLTHQVRYRGQMPCTGPLICGMCLTLWDPRDGSLIEVRHPAAVPTATQVARWADDGGSNLE